MALRELKVCLLGDTGVGKSSIVWRFVEDSFDPNINPTIGASFMTKTVQYQNELHKFLIWDTAGQERFRALAPMYYRGSAAAIIVYDITKEESFTTLKNWVKELRQHGPPNIVVAIAGNKCDLSDAREVPEKDAKDYADSIHAIFVETSAKNAININEVFIEIMCFVFSKVSASPLLTQQEELQEKLSNWDVRPQNLAGLAADDAGDCPHVTFDLTFALSLCPRRASAYSHHTLKQPA
ncbi:ras-related protein Rab-22A isoform X1 [Eleginops maclovinus]|uniref:ras-related protein Rab-22A isoform X1 n=1 Tax=Eleginops maclovinus TaxID=56733 RepID=UPI003080263A